MDRFNIFSDRLASMSFVSSHDTNVLNLPSRPPARLYMAVKAGSERSDRATGRPAMNMDDEVIQTPDGPMTWAQWKKKNPVQIPSRRTTGKDLPVKVKRFTNEA
jgi:hypothetical protein